MTDRRTVVVERDVECAVRDRTVLRADVYRPRDGGRYPTLVCRTPYDKERLIYAEVAEPLAEAGYCVVVQDIRGRHASDGDFRWMFGPSSQTNAASDGFDTVEWAATLPWSDGRVGAFGHSYDGWSVWMMLSAQPPSLKAALPSGIGPNLLSLTSGVFETGRRLEWTYTMGAVDPRTGSTAVGPIRRDEATRRWRDVERGKYLWWLPLADIPPAVFSGLGNDLLEFHESQNIEKWDFTEVYSAVEIPVMQVTGWWDRLIGTVDNFVGITLGEAEGGTGAQHRLVIGPWGHDSTELTGRLGPVDYGQEADRTYAGLVQRWFDYQLKGVDNGLAEEDPVQLFVPGENRWRGETAWPPARIETTALYLHSAGQANTVAGNGSLSTVPPGGEASPADRHDLGLQQGRSGADSDEYDYDPYDPVMSLMRSDSQAVPVDQAPHDDRLDVLFYETAPVDEALELVGPVRFRLWASSDGPDTDWTAKLAVVHADGIAINLTSGILRAQYRSGYDEPELLVAGEVYEYDIVLNPVGIRLQPGQKLRLYVSSSDFPNFDRNHNTGNSYWRDTSMRTARQTVFHSASRPSHLLLPLIPL